MSELNRQQKDFVAYVKEDNKKKLDVNDSGAVLSSIIINWFEMYLTAEKETDKVMVAGMISRLRPDILEQIKFWSVLVGTNFPGRVKEYYRNKNRTNIHSQKRRHKYKDFDGMTYEEWEHTLEYFNRQCAYCGEGKKLTFDHVHPFSKGGDFIKSNIVPACISCNSSKNSRDIEEWYRDKDFYRKERRVKINKFMNEYSQLTLF